MLREQNLRGTLQEIGEMLDEIQCVSDSLAIMQEGLNQNNVDSRYVNALTLQIETLERIFKNGKDICRETMTEVNKEDA